MQAATDGDEERGTNATTDGDELNLTVVQAALEVVGVLGNLAILDVNGEGGFWFINVCDGNAGVSYQMLRY